MLEKKIKEKMKRNASKRDERHGRSRHGPTKVLEFVKFNLATLRVAIKLKKNLRLLWK